MFFQKFVLVDFFENVNNAQCCFASYKCNKHIFCNCNPGCGNVLRRMVYICILAGWELLFTVAYSPKLGGPVGNPRGSGLENFRLAHLPPSVAARKGLDRCDDHRRANSTNLRHEPQMATRMPLLRDPERSLDNIAAAVRCNHNWHYFGPYFYQRLPKC